MGSFSSWTARGAWCTCSNRGVQEKSEMPAIPKVNTHEFPLLLLPLVTVLATVVVLLAINGCV